MFRRPHLHTSDAQPERAASASSFQLEENLREIARQVVLGTDYPYLREYLAHFERPSQDVAAETLEWCAARLREMPPELVNLLLAEQRPTSVFEFLDDFGHELLVSQFGESEASNPAVTEPAGTYSAPAAATFESRIRLDELRPVIAALYGMADGSLTGIEVQLRQEDRIAALRVARGEAYRLNPANLLLLEVARSAAPDSSIRRLQITLAVVKETDKLLFTPVTRLLESEALVEFRPCAMDAIVPEQRFGERRLDLFMWVREQVGLDVQW